MLVLKFAELRRQVSSPIDIVIDVKEAVLPGLQLFSLASFASSSLGIPAVDRESNSLEKYSSTLLARTLDWVTNICRGLSIESCFNLNARSIPSILNSIVVVFLREL